MGSEAQTAPAQSPQKVVSKIYDSPFISKKSVRIATTGMYAQGKVRKRWGSYNLLILKMTIDVAAPLEFGHRQPPTRRFRTPTRDVPRRSAPREEPDADRTARPFRSDNASTVGIEPIAVGSCVLALDIAASVAGLIRSECVAVAGGKGAGKAGIVDCATVRGV